MVSEASSAAHHPSSETASHEPASEASAHHAHAASESSPETTSEASSTHGVSVLSDLDTSTEPLEAVELSDGVGGVLRRLIDDDTAALGSTVRERLDVGSNDVSCGSEEVLEVLPASLIRQLWNTEGSTGGRGQPVCSDLYKGEEPAERTLPM